MAANHFLAIFLISFFISSNLQNIITQVDGANSSVPCFFIFGDSLADNGNNNNLLTVAKADFSPYGVDFAGGPTGRFTNNRTAFDVITQLLGFDNFIPPFANATGQEILKGVNYASAAAGIFDISGTNQGAVISMNQQLRNHMTTVASINFLLRNNITSANAYLKQCLYTVGMGSNDYLNNYFLPENPISDVFTPDQFANLLVTNYNLQLRKLYSLGARKVAIMGLGLLGSTPAIVAKFGANASAVTNASQLFTNKLPNLVNTLNTQLPGANFTYINVTGITLTSPALATLNVTGTCCQVVDVLYTCAKGIPPCSNRNQIVFFDGFHPTDVVNEGLAQRAFTETLPTDASPYDISTLVGL